MIVSPRRPTSARLAAFADKQLSTLRALEYEIVHELRLKGRVIDLGGGKRSHYASMLAIDGTLESLNADARMEPTFLHDANTPFPIADATYDAGVSFNTFEHIRRDEHALGEFIRILKAGGKFHIIVPFVYRVHGSPSDYHRHTCHWWEETLVRLGVPAGQSRIEPITWGRLSTAFTTIEQTRLRFLRGLALRLDILLNDDLTIVADYPIGYYVSGTKP